MAAGAQHTWMEHGWEVQAVQRISRVLGPVQDKPEKRARRCLLGRTNQAGCSLPTQRSLLSGGVSQREEWVEGAELRLAVWLTRGYGLPRLVEHTRWEIDFPSRGRTAKTGYAVTVDNDLPTLLPVKIGRGKHEHFRI